VIAPPAPVAARPAATLVTIAGGPLGVDVSDATGRVYVVDHSALLWILDRGQMTLRRPFTLSGEPVAVIADPLEPRLYVALRGQPALSVLDSESGQEVARVALLSNPSEVRLDVGLGLAFVAEPETDQLEIVDVRGGRMAGAIAGLPQVTGIAIDQDAHIVYVTQLDGTLSVLDAAGASVTARMTLSDVGLNGVVLQGGWVMTINTPGRQVLAYYPPTGDVSPIRLDAEPVAIVGGASSITVLEPATNAVVRIDPVTGAELSRTSIGAAIDSPSLDARDLWLRPRMAISAADERVYVTAPQSSLLAVLPAL
jgi:DNA-binding beta-propeller fold protein YncE